MHTITIKHSYQVGDTIFYMENNAVKSGTISGIFVESFHAHLIGKNPGSPTDFVSISYWIEGNDSRRFPPSLFFKSKDELLKTL